jgi:hypothetical protein
MFSATSILSRPFSPSDGPDVPDFRDSRDAPHARDATDTSDAVGRYPGCRRSCRGCMMDAPRRVSNYRWTRATRPVSDLASAWCVCGNWQVQGVCRVRASLRSAGCTVHTHVREVEAACPPIHAYQAASLRRAQRKLLHSWCARFLYGEPARDDEAAEKLAHTPGWWCMLLQQAQQQGLGNCCALPCRRRCGRPLLLSVDVDLAAS